MRKGKRHRTTRATNQQQGNVHPTAPRFKEYSKLANSTNTRGFDFIYWLFNLRMQWIRSTMKRNWKLVFTLLFEAEVKRLNKYNQSGASVDKRTELSTKCISVSKLCLVYFKWDSSSKTLHLAILHFGGQFVSLGLDIVDGTDHVECTLG